MAHEKPQAAVVRETRRIAVGTAILLVAMLVVYAAMGRFGISALLGGLIGAAYAVFNFFMLGMSVQKAANETDQEMARMRMRASYQFRMLGMVVLVIVAFVIPFLDGLACLIPMVFPRLTILALQLTGQIKDS